MDIDDDDEEEKFDEIGNVIRVGDITFATKEDDPEGIILGSGAYATVRLAKRVTQEGKEELVAVKVFSKSLLKRMRTLEKNSETNKVQVRTALEKVEREIAIMKMMRHPNIVSLLEVIDSVSSDSLYMVLEYMPRGEIMSYMEGTGCFQRRSQNNTKSELLLLGCLDDGRRFDETHAALYFVDVLHGLCYLHQNGICHRDLKPENILVGADGQVKISDFGVSHFFREEKVESLPTDEEKQFHSALSMKGMSRRGMLTKLEGTWCFYSPEMCGVSSFIEDDKSTRLSFSGYAADVWAAGVCLYIFVTGKLPFFSEDPCELFDRICNTPPLLEEHMSKDLTSILQMLLEKDPDLRAGLGDCLAHPFCRKARQERIRKYTSGVLRNKRKLVVSDEDLRSVR